MGNKQAKASLDAVQIGACNLHGDDGTTNAISSTFVTAADTELSGHAKLPPHRGYEYISKADDGLGFHATSMGMGTKAQCYDQSGNEVCFLKVKNKGTMNADEHHLFRSEPSYPGQVVAPLEDKEVEGKKLYHFAKIDVKRKLRKAEAVYSVITGHESDGEPKFEELYRAEKLPAMRFYVQIFMIKIQMQGSIPMGVSSVPVAKMMDHGMTRKGPRIDVEMSKGCDLAAVILVGQACAPSGNTAGAMAGAGVH